ncbi:hypothetical protein MBANPS3_003078 [Mucor bainieri]
MSTIPDDLAVASEFAAQGLPPATIVKAEQIDVKKEQTESTKVVDPPAPSNVEAAPNSPSVKAEPMEVDDTLDKAIAGKTEKGYESSDIDISSDEDDSSDSSSDSSSSSSDDEDDNDDDEMGTTAATKALGDEDDEQYPDGIVKTAHEIVDIVVEKPQFEMTPQTEIIFAGSIFQIIDNVIVIHCKPHSEYSTLDQGSLLVYENREVMGEVFETFGPVARPYYSVRFNDAKEINQEFAKVGQDVYFVPSYQKTQIVETEKLRKIKGTDASNVYDEEVGEDELEFSDDEKEMEYKQRKNREKKMKKRGLPVDHLNKEPKSQQQQPRQRGQQRYQQRKPARDLPDDFDSALAAYEQHAPPPPPRQQQSYADLMDDYMGASSSTHTAAAAAAPPPPPQYYPPPQQQQQQQQYQPAASQQQAYQSPADLVSALYKSYGGTLPTQLPSSLPQAQQHQPAQQQPQQQQQLSARSLFSQPPPPISDLEKPN